MKFNVDEKLYGHPKWASLTDAAKALWVTAGAYAIHHRTDGLITYCALKALGKRPNSARMLVEAGLWETHPEGWVFHDWAKYNLTTAQVRRQAELNRQRQAKYRRKRR